MASYPVDDNGNPIIQTGFDPSTGTPYAFGDLAIARDDMVNRIRYPTLSDGREIRTIYDITKVVSEILANVATLAERVNELSTYREAETLTATNEWQEKEEQRRGKVLQLAGDIAMYAGSVNGSPEDIIEAAEQFNMYVRSGMTPKARREWEDEQAALDEGNVPVGQEVDEPRLGDKLRPEYVKPTLNVDQMFDDYTKATAEAE